MLDINFIRKNPKKVKQGAKHKGVDVDIDKILKLDKQRRNLIQEVEELKAEKNKLGAEQRDEAKKIKGKIKKIEPELEKVEKQFNQLTVQVPNLPLENVPIGKNEKDNKVVRKQGKTKPGANSYLEISEKLDIIDIKRAAKVSGTRFGYLKQGLALLEFGLVQLALDILTKQGFIPIIPPVLIKPEMMQAMGYMEQGGIDEIYHIPKDDLYLIGTAEQSIGPMHADEVFNEKDLPRRYAAFSSCFRREAGSYGKDTKGILRVHQFDKLEMFSFCKLEDSVDEHKLFLSLEEKLMKALKLPYQVVQLCTGDLSFVSASTYDIETWMPGQGTYRETHSASNCTDFQSRRLNIRYRSGRDTNFVHTINGTAFAIGRTLIAIIENYQQKDGSIKIPLALKKYVNIDKIS